MSWQAFERIVYRLLLHDGYEGLRLIGESGDGGADVLGHKFGKRWLVQVKRWSNSVGPDVVDRTVQAMHTYRADIPVVVSRSGFTSEAVAAQQALLAERVPLQLWDKQRLIDRASRLTDRSPVELDPDRFTTRPYQEEAIQAVVRAYVGGDTRRAMVVMATGLGKTYVAAEALRRLGDEKPMRVLAIAHTNDLVYQLERALWPFMRPSLSSAVWNGYEKPTHEVLASAPLVVACLDTVVNGLEELEELHFDALLVDECHHAGSESYKALLAASRAAQNGGPFLIGLTATPWRSDETDLRGIFGDPIVTIDLVTGLRNGFLSNVDYRMYTDNIDWEALRQLRGASFTPRGINRTMFIPQWDEGVIDELQRVWSEQSAPRALIFCGTIEHALMVRDRLNARGFCVAEAIFSRSAGRSMTPFERNRILCDFHDRKIDVICAVDVLNEGIDLPDVNLLVFQRVTHSRRIFVQQLGRGLRIAPGKQKVIVLDFVSDIRRFAAGLELKDRLARSASRPATLVLPNQVSFHRAGGGDPAGETFLRQWLEDASAVADSEEDAAVLRFPPELPGSAR